MICIALAPRTPVIFARLPATHPVVAFVRLVSSALFDVVRVNHAGWVQVGWIEPSIIASGRLERMLDTLEKLALGPLARRV